MVFFLPNYLRFMQFITCDIRNLQLSLSHQQRTLKVGKMSTSANRKMIVLPPGMKFTPVYSKCPKCGCDLQKWHDSFIDQVSTNQTKHRSSDTKRAFEAMPHKSLPHSLFDNCVAWMVFPFSAAKKHTTKRNQKR